MPVVSAVVGVVGAIGSAIGGVIAGAASFLAGGTFLAGVAKFGLNLAANYVLGKLFGPKQQAQAVELDTQYGEDLARSVALGRTGRAGHRIYRNSFGRGGRTVQDVYVLSHFRITDVPRVRVDGEWKTLGGPEHAERGFRVQDIEPQIWVKIYHGHMDQEADPGLVARSNPPGRWTQAHRGAGVAYAVVTMQLDRDRLQRPWEAFFEVLGAPLYDWRKDSSVGGDGPHRWNDQDTWEYSENPKLMMYGLERGFWNGDQLMVGKGVPASRLPLDKWTLAANIDDEHVDGGPRYKAGLIARAGRGIRHEANMTPLIEASAASWIEDASGEYPIAGAAQPIVATISDADDIMIDQPFRYAARRPRAELVNAASGSFHAAERFYEAAPLAYRQDDNALALDGERLAVNIGYSAVNDADVGDRLIDIALRGSRYEASADIWLRPKFMTLKPGQWIAWEHGNHGLRVFQVMSKALGAMHDEAARAVRVQLQEVGEGIFDPTAYHTAPPLPVTAGAPDYQSELDDYQIAGATIRSETGSERPAGRASWAPIEDPTIVGVEFEYRVKAEPEVTLTETASPDQTVAYLANGMVSSTGWQARYRLVASPRRPIPWTSWREFITPPARLGPPDLYLDEVVEEILDQVNEFNAFATTGTREALERVRQMRDDSAAADAIAYTDRRKITNETVLQIGETRAYVREEIDLAVGPDSAIVTQINEQGVQITQGLAAVRQETTTRVDALEGAITTQLSEQRSEYLGGIAEVNEFVITQVGALEGSFTASLNEQRSEYLGGISAANDLIQTEVARVDGEITSTGERISTLESEVDGVVASFTSRVQTMASPGGGVVRAVMQFKAGTLEDFVSSSLLFEVDSNGIGSAGFITNRFFIIDPSNPAARDYPFLYEAGELALRSMRAQTLKAGRLESLDGQNFIDFSGSGAVIDIRI